MAQYSILNDTQNGIIAIDSLKEEIESNSSITIALNNITTSGDNLNINFKANLPAAEETILTGLVNSHEGISVIQEEIEKVEVNSNPAFASKVLPNGKKIFQRVHGVSQALSSGSNTIDYSVPYPVIKFNEIEIIGGEAGDTIDLKILDDASGTYTTIPNYQLNQFGFNVNVTPGYYDRSSNYDADLFIGMRIIVEYNSVSDKTIYINFIQHEIKD